MLKRLVFLLIYCFLSGVSYAHIGSAGVAYEGKVGNYQVQVYIEPPDVIPGTAKVTVLTDGTDITKIEITPIYFFAGDEGSPRADLAFPTNEVGRYEGSVWFMESGSASVKVKLTGGRGEGTVVIPVVAVSTAKRQMPASMAWFLAALALLLVGLMTTIIGASNSDSLMQPGQTDTIKTRRNRVVGSVVGVSFCVLLVWGGNSWWNSWANDYTRFSYKPYTATATIQTTAGQQLLNVQIDSASVNKRWLSYLIPDHGKLMHLFLVRQGSMDVFAHLHPARKDTLNFQAVLPSLPAGRYLLYADFVRYHGFAYTIADTLDIPSPSAKIAASEQRISSDPEDTYVVTNPINKSQPLLQDANFTLCGLPGVKTKLQDGSSIVWEEKTNKPLQQGRLYSLKFSVLDPSGKPAQLETYLGMMGHAAVVKDDGSVYIHLHPTGTFSTASQQVLEKRIAETSQRSNPADAKAFRDSVDRVLAQIKAMPTPQREQWLMQSMNHQMNSTHHASVTIPYAFPQVGKYRIWLQVKRNGRILTGAFEADVQ